RGLGALSASEPVKWVLRALPTMRIMHETVAKTHASSRNFIAFPSCCAAVCRTYRSGCMAGLREGGEEGLRERVFQRLVFGVPLHADDESGARQADPLDLPVRRDRLDKELRGRAVDPLPVQRVDHQLGGAGELDQPAALGEPDR